MKLLRLLGFVLLTAGTLGGCIGTDVIDDMGAVVPPNEPMPTDTLATDTVAVAARRGTLQGQGGYTSVGTVTLLQNEAGEVILTTSSNFEVSFAAGTFLYLSNSQSGSTTFTEGLEVADVSDTPTGAQTFNVSLVDPTVSLSTYRYVVVLCKPFRLTFGVAELD
jgi:hypothetical protein